MKFNEENLYQKNPTQGVYRSVDPTKAKSIKDLRILIQLIFAVTGGVSVIRGTDAYALAEHMLHDLENTEGDDQNEL